MKPKIMLPKALPPRTWASPCPELSIGTVGNYGPTHDVLCFIKDCFVIHVTNAEDIHNCSTDTNMSNIDDISTYLTRSRFDDEERSNKLIES